MKRRSQSGFAVVETLLVVVILALVAGTGYYVWHAQQKTNDTLNAANKSSNSSVTTKKSSTPATTTSDNATVYLDIKEWGVKMPLQADVKDAYYAMPAGPDFAVLSLESLKGTTCAADRISLGGIERFTATTTDPETGKTLLSQNPSAVKVGDHYYAFTHTQAACGGDKTTQNKAAADQLILQQQAKFLQAD